MKNTLLWNAALLGLIGLGCQNLHNSNGNPGAADEEEDEQEIALSEVPQAAKDAALAAVPGLLLEEAETESQGGARIYCLEGTANGKEYEIEVTADGRILEVESEETEDEEDD